MVRPRTNKTDNSERGMALLVALLALLLVSAISVGLIVMSNSETSISSNFRDEQVAFFGARGGLEEIRDRLRTGATSSLNASLPSALPGSNNGVLYITNPIGSETVAPWNTTGSNYPDDEICKEVTCVSSIPGGSPWYTTASYAASYAASPQLPWKWVRVTAKTNKSDAGTIRTDTVDGATNGNRICWNGTNEVTVTAASCSANVPPYQPVYILTALAVTPSGSRRMVQAEAVPGSLSLNLPGALTVDGPSLASSTICASGSTCNSSGAYITGNEPASCTTGGTVPAIAVLDAATQSNFVPANQTQGVNPNKANIVGAGGTPSVGNASSALQNLNTVSQVEALVSQMAGLAGSNTCTTSCGSVNLGTAANPTVTFVNNAGGSDFQLNSGTTGYGILVVTGGLQYVNVNSYQGVILMLGTAQFTETSSKDTTLTGALFMAQDRDPTTGALLAGPALGTTPVFNYHHGNANAGDPSIQYNACVINQVEAAAAPNYKVVADREMMY